MYENRGTGDDSGGFSEIIHGKTMPDLFDEYMMNEEQVMDTIDYA